MHLGTFLKSCTENLTNKSITLYYAIALYGSGDNVHMDQNGLLFDFGLRVEHGQRKLKKMLPYMLCANAELLLGTSYQLISSALLSN